MKIAIIIVGIFEYDEKILNSAKNCYLLDAENTDIFIYNNNTFENNEKLKKYFNDNNCNVATINSKQYCTDVIDVPKNITKKATNDDNIKLNWKKFKISCKKKNIFENKNISNHVPFKSEKFFDNIHICSREQYEQIYLALNKIDEYEKQNGKNYDYIMKIRLDFYLKNNYFSPLHYFNDKNDILFKSYNNIKYLYEKINEDDAYHQTEFRINNYLYWRTSKYLGGQYLLNKHSYEKIINEINNKNRDRFNEIIKNEFVITINDACFFSSAQNFKIIIKSLCERYGEFYSDESLFWWTPECQFLLSIISNGISYFDYLQNDNYYNGIEMWFNNYHGTEKYINQ